MCLTQYSFSKMVCAEVSKTTGASKRVFHQTVNAHNSMLTKEIHDQGKINFILITLVIHQSADSLKYKQSQ